MKTLWGKFLCRVWFRKHKPGRLNAFIANTQLEEYRCPRCGATWTRRSEAKAAPAIPAIPASIRK